VKIVVQKDGVVSVGPKKLARLFHIVGYIDKVALKRAANQRCLRLSSSKERPELDDAPLYLANSKFA